MGAKEVEMTLMQIEESVWETLHADVQRPGSSFRYLTLCSVDHRQTPKARIVVLRKVDPRKRTLEFHTDTRSPKWHELTGNPSAAVLGYCAETRLQFRFEGHVTLFEPSSDYALTVWSSLPLHTRGTYAGGPPGDELPEPHAPIEALQDQPEGQQGRDRFGIIVFSVTSLDWFKLSRQSNVRAQFGYDDNGGLMSSSWVNP